MLNLEPHAPVAATPDSDRPRSQQRNLVDRCSTFQTRSHLRGRSYDQERPFYPVTCSPASPATSSFN